MSLPDHIGQDVWTQSIRQWPRCAIDLEQRGCGICMRHVLDLRVAGGFTMVSAIAVNHPFTLLTAAR